MNYISTLASMSFILDGIFIGFLNIFINLCLELLPMNKFKKHIVFISVFISHILYFIINRLLISNYKTFDLKSYALTLIIISFLFISYMSSSIAIGLKKSNINFIKQQYAFFSILSVYIFYFILDLIFRNIFNFRISNFI